MPLLPDTIWDHTQRQAAREELQRVLDVYPKKGQAIRHNEVSSERKAGSEKRSNY